MTELVRIVVNLPPEGKRRHRTRVVKPKEKYVKPWVQEYPDPEQREHCQKIAKEIKRAWRKNPVTNPVLLGLVAFMPIPKSAPKYKQQLMRSGHIRPISKPDLSNIIKLVEDVANGIIWRDDSQIVGYLQTAKYYSDAPKYVLTVQVLPVDSSDDAKKQQLPLLEVPAAADELSNANGVR